MTDGHNGREEAIWRHIHHEHEIKIQIAWDKQELRVHVSLLVPHNMCHPLPGLNFVYVVHTVDFLKNIKDILLLLSSIC